MGEIKKSKVIRDKVFYTMTLSEKEHLDLKERRDRVHIFCSDLCTTDAEIMERGLGGVVKYFIIPHKYRTKNKRKIRSISYQSLETDTHVFYIYTCEKEISTSELPYI